MKNQTTIKSELNKTGVFLESAIYNTLRKNKRYKVFREEPYSGYTSEGFEGVIDMLLGVHLPDEGLIICFLIESKKADLEQKKWVVDKLRKPMEDTYSFDYYNAGIKKFDYSKNIFFPSLGYNGMKFFDRGIQTFEFNETTGKLSRNQGERPYLALRHVNEAVSSFLDERRDRVFEIMKTNVDQYDILYIPVVFTTAELFVINYDAENIDLVKGEIDIKDVDLEQKDWIHYEFPLPYSLRTRTEPGLGPVKRPSFIVRADKCETFIEMLSKDCESYIL